MTSLSIRSSWRKVHKVLNPRGTGRDGTMVCHILLLVEMEVKQSIIQKILALILPIFRNIYFEYDITDIA